MLNELIIQMWGKATQTSVNDFACVFNSVLEVCQVRDMIIW